MRAIIIDDEEPVRKELAALLQDHCPMVQLVGMAHDAISGMAMIMGQQPELVFLDIMMPGQDGFELLQSLEQYDFAVVFVTGHSQYGIQALKAAAVDYLLKPVRPAELLQAVWRAVRRREQGQTKVLLETLMHNLKHAHDQQEYRIALPTMEMIHLLRPNNILLCEALNNYTRFHLKDGEKLLVSMGLYEFNELEDYGFVRPQHSQLVNMAHVDKVLRKDNVYELLLSNGARVPISRRRKDMVLDRLYKRKKGK